MTIPRQRGRDARIPTETSPHFLLQDNPKVHGNYFQDGTNKNLYQ